MKTLVVTLLVIAGASSAHAEEMTCGLVGGLKDRIADCEATVGPEATRVASVAYYSQKNESYTTLNYTWKLITRTAKGKDVWFDKTGQRLWTDFADQPLNQNSAVNLCSDSEAGAELRAGIPLTFRLPALYDYLDEFEGEIQQKNGVARALRIRTGYALWTSSPSQIIMVTAEEPYVDMIARSAERGEKRLVQCMADLPNHN